MSNTHKLLHRLKSFRIFKKKYQTVQSWLIIVKKHSLNKAFAMRLNQNKKLFNIWKN